MIAAASADTYQEKPPRFELRVALAYFAIFMSSGLHLPYFPLWLEYRSLTPTQIAIVLSMPLFVRVIAAPLVSMLADRSNDRAHILTIATILAVLVAAFYFVPFGFAGILVVSLALAPPWTSQVPLADTIALSGVRRYGADFAKMRVWGSISFLLTSFVGGIFIQNVGEHIIPWALLGTLIAACAMSFIVPRIGKPRRLSPLSDVDMADAGRALRRPAFVTFLIATGITQASHAYGYSFSAIYWKSIGIGETMIGTLWSISVVAEVIMFTCFRRLFGRLHPAKVLMIGSAVAMFRWTVFPLIAPAGLGVAGFLVVQSLHAFSFALSFLGMQKMIALTIPEERGGTAQGLSTFFIGTSLAIVTMASGPLYSATGIYGFYVMVAFAAFGLFLANVSLRLEQREA
ncbi:MFS transporter [Phyllobacterium sophorae]|jgi:MFS transporter, PPP family, 3-phenylpropionic acid transporter|uniref:MFS transporter n=1 Tax=Phyllobacterium sophorae TaxID=1520277 RepID=A0A2P7BHW9_9HYPH|nr:MFS transporter [Phyllobacterium sophorae]PSH66075.1 MFS transporter [Phyllobacterium sophorae]